MTLPESQEIEALVEAALSRAEGSDDPERVAAMDELYSALERELAREPEPEAGV